MPRRQPPTAGDDAATPADAGPSADATAPRRATGRSFGSAARRHAADMTAEPSPERGRVAFVGLGTMGGAMAANLARAGFEVSAWNRTPGRAPELEELGVDDRARPGRGRRRCRHRRHLRLRHARRRGRPVRPRRRRRAAPARARLVVDMSTISPSGSATSPTRLRRARVAMLDAPVSGGSEGAKKGTLTIFVGGDAADLERARPVLESLGRTITHVGPIGAGQAVKAVNQVILAGDLPRRGRGHRPRDQGRPRRRAGRRGARRRRRPVLGPRQPQRPDARQRLPARVQGRAPPQGPRHRPRLARELGASLPVSALRGPARDRADRQRPRRRRHVRPRARRSAALSGLDD